MTGQGRLGADSWHGAAGQLTSLPWALAVSAVAAGAVLWGAGRDAVPARAARLFADGLHDPKGARVSSARTRAVALVRARMRPQWWCPVAGVLAAVGTASVLPLLLGGLSMPLVRRASRGRAVRRARASRTDAVITLCGVLAGEVRAGRQPAAGLLTALRECGGLGGAEAAVVAAARFGGDVPGALRSASGEPGAEGLVGLAACWRVAVDRGAGLAAGLERLERSLTAERDQRADLEAQLTGARATALLLAGLPLLGLLVGTALGANPLRVLLHTSAGLMCLGVGGALEAVGLWWALGLVRRAETGAGAGRPG
ncbi:type II secretion system F family protein [Streptomyces sp. NPDC007088]|uniref:type II secretion system F family protein n=1 Tax=Streptomyces sp. NPDC007088 TaxID=3364773 RepID=UPI00368BD02D